MVISEAVELAKRYSTDESGRFVNGVLARLAVDSRGEAPPGPHIARGWGALAGAGAGLDQHPVAVRHVLADSVGGQTDPGFAALDLFRNTDEHGSILHLNPGCKHSAFFAPFPCYSDCSNYRDVIFPPCFGFLSVISCNSTFSTARSSPPSPVPAA